MAQSEVKFDRRGLRLVRRGWFRRPATSAVAWAGVERVEARRGASGPAELIVHGADGSRLTAAGDQRGFDALRAALPALLPRSDEAWWAALHAAPAMERRFLVWERT